MKKTLKKLWWFIWHDNSIWSWIVNVVLAFLIVKFLVYPGLGVLLGTTHPVVAVISNSMNHNGVDFDDWWNKNKELYEQKNLTKEEFLKFRFVNGFDKGDLIVLKGVKCSKVDKGDILVYNIVGNQPIIHRVVDTNLESDYYFQTKGDNVNRVQFFEEKIKQSQVIGFEKYKKCSVGVFRIPWLGWIKILFTNLIGGI